MHGQECRAKGCDAFDAARHRVADIVQLEIGEYFLAGAGKLADGRKANALKGALLKALNDDETAPTGGRPRLERARASVGR